MKKILYLVLLVCPLILVSCNDKKIPNTSQVNNMNEELSKEVTDNKELSPKEVKVDEVKNGIKLEDTLNKFRNDVKSIDTIVSENKNILRINFDMNSNTNDEYISVYNKVFDIVRDIKDYEWIDKVAILGFAELEDEYANKSNSMVLSFEYDKDAINKINWDNISLDKFIKLSTNVFKNNLNT